MLASKRLQRVCKREEGDGMKKSILVATVVLVFATMMFAQASSATQNSTGQSTPNTTTNSSAQANSSSSANAAGSSAQGAIAEGTAINAELSKGIDSKKAKEGDQVQAKVVQDVLANGKIVVPRNSKLLGHVTQVKAGGKGEASSLGIAFDKAVLKNGQEVPVHAVIQALAPAPRMPAGNPGYGDSDAGMSAAGGMQSPQGGSYGTTGGGGMNSGPVGGATSTVGGVAGSAAGAAGNVGTTAANTAGGAVGNTTNTVGMTTSGQLTAASRGVMGLPGITLNADTNTGTNGSVITNQNKNVKLDGGTQMVLRVTAQ
jgi:hypothetical protein